jgi:hypothetical protein
MNSDEKRARNEAKKVGLVLRKRRARNSYCSPSGYVLIDPMINGVVAGATPLPYSLTLAEVAEIISSRA